MSSSFSDEGLGILLINKKNQTVPCVMLKKIGDRKSRVKNLRDCGCATVVNFVTNLSSPFHKNS